VFDSDPQLFSNKTSFAVVRNPWDRIVSAYSFLKGGGTKFSKADVFPFPPLLMSFEVFVHDYIVPSADRLESLDEVLRPQHVFVNDKSGNPLVEHLGRFEALDAFQDYLIEIGAVRERIAHLNRSPRREFADYRHYFSSNALIEAVGSAYARDAAQFSYRFD
jgi:chondroitin 4-sulfotransferase 11